MPKLFDIHSHINFSDFDKDKDEVIQRALDAGVWMINVGSDFETSKKAIELAEKYESGVYASIGLHPNDNKKEIFDISKYRELAKNPKVVAIGECGIDMFRQTKEDMQRQTDIFKQQIKLALELDKPLIIHCRDSHDEVIEILASFDNKNSKLRGDIHFFTGTLEQAQKYIDMGFLISFTGVITFSKQYDNIIKNVLLDKIMIETDAPFVAPSLYRGKRNEPLYVEEVAKKIAEIKKISCEEVYKLTLFNSLKLFGINHL